MKRTWRRAVWPAVPVVLVVLAGCGGGSHGEDGGLPTPTGPDTSVTEPADDVSSPSTDPATDGTSSGTDDGGTPDNGGTPSDDGGSGGSDASGGSDGGSSGGSAGDSGDTTPTVPGEVRATGLTQFEMVQGRPAWQSAAQNRAANSVLDLYPNGSFSFTTVDTVGVPLGGSYTVSGSEVDFEGQSVTPGPAGSTTLEIQGSVDLGAHTMTLHWVASSGMGAVVDGQSFASANSVAWNADVPVSFG